jgi:hypothetical protein
MKRHEFEIALFDIFKSGRPAIGQDHGRTIRGHDGIEVDAFRQAAKLREEFCDIFGLELLDVSQLAFAPCFQFKIFQGYFHGKHLLVPNAHSGMSAISTLRRRYEDVSDVDVLRSIYDSHVVFQEKPLDAVWNE